MGRWAGPVGLGIVVSGCSLLGGIVQAPQAVSIDCATAAVIEVDKEKIEKSGVSSDVLEVLRKGIPSFQGRGNAGASKLLPFFPQKTHQFIVGNMRSTQQISQRILAL